MSPTVNHPKSIRKIYLIFAPAYRHMINATIPKIITVHKSGISKKTKKSNVFSIKNEVKNSLVFTLSRFLISHPPKNKIYPNLKNSAGWILGKNGISIHHLDPLRTTHIPGTNTRSWSTMSAIAIMVMFF